MAIGEQIADVFINLLKKTMIAILKTFFTAFNFIPTKAIEIHGARGTSSTNRPDLRELGSVIGGQKVRFGTYIIAYERGAIIQKQFGNGEKITGIRTEVYMDIQDKWIW